MVIVICILGGLLLCALCAIAILWIAINKIMDAYIESNPKEFIGYYFDEQTEKKYNCTLLLTINDSADFDGSIYDFSQYEKNNIIGLTECRKKTTEHGNDEESQIALIPNQTVCKMKDGSFQWDFRGLI
jgi:hypothetical protein